MQRYDIKGPLTDDMLNKTNSMFKSLFDEYVAAGKSAAVAERMAREAVAHANAAVAMANLAKTETTSTQRQLDSLIIESGTSDAETIQARGGEPLLKDRLNKSEQLLLDTNTNILESGVNLIRYSDFKKLPPINSRSSVYSFTPNIDNPKKKDKSLRIASTGYAESSDANKDFSLILSERILDKEVIEIVFWANPTVSGKTITLRLAYSSNSISVGLGNANQWNKIKVSINANITQPTDSIFVDFKSSFTLFLSDLRVSVVNLSEVSFAKSFAQVEEKLTETPTIVQNSNGSIERLISVGQTYLDKVSEFSYGNFNTAYDKEVKKIDGKYVIDCSSFASLLVHGVPFNKSRYASSENTESNLFYNGIDSYKYRYANQMAFHAQKKGFTFKPNEDMSNILPGDVVFFSWTLDESGEGDGADPDKVFMGIQHVGIYLQKKNENVHSTLQFDNGITSVFVDVTPEYMSQCVLVARLPFADTGHLYDTDNIVLDGGRGVFTSNQTTIKTYDLTKPLKKGRYYTLFIDGNTITENSYFLVQANGQTIFSDSGKEGGYDGVSKFHFSYLQNTEAISIELLVGAKTGVGSNRSADVKWVSLHEGYLKDKKSFNPPIQQSVVRELTLGSGLTSDLISTNVPYHQYIQEGNKLLLNISLPFKTSKSGGVNIATLGVSLRPVKTQRFPVTLVTSANEGIAGFLQVSSAGTVVVQAYGSTSWTSVLSSVTVFLT